MVGYWWIIAVVVVTAILQVAVYRRLRDRDRSRSLQSSVAGVARSSRAAESKPDDDRMQLCPSCGTSNDPAYTFCRRCASRIGA